MGENKNLSKDSRAYKREKQKGERWDGYLVKNIPSVQKLMPYLMKTRNSSSVYFRDTFDATNLVNFLNDKNKKLISDDISSLEDINRYNFNHFFMAAIVRVLA